MAGHSKWSQIKRKKAINDLAKSRERNKVATKTPRTDIDKSDYESITYEGYGPAGVAVMVIAETNNKNRTASNIRHAFEKNGGSLGVTGAVSYIFIEVDGEYLADFSVAVPTDKEAVFAKFLEMLDADDDVVEVIHNAE